MLRTWLTICLLVALPGILVVAVPVVPVGFAGAKQPQVAVTSNGIVTVTFGRQDGIYCATSFDRAKTFSPPIKVASVDKLALGMRRGPRISASVHQTIISAISHTTGDLCVWTSDDRTNWVSRGAVNDKAAAAREGLHAMASDGRQQLYLVWLDLRGNKTEIWGALSQDEGKTWQKNVRIYQSPDGSVCECCHPSVTFTPRGEIAVMWRNSLHGARDMFSALSKDGQIFTGAKRIGEMSWVLKGCPMDGGAMAVSHNGEIVSIWRGENSIFTTSGSGQEKRLGNGTQPIIFAGAGQMHFVWQHGLQLILQNDRQPGLSKVLAENGRYAAAASAGFDKPAVIVWEAETIMAEWIE